MKIKFVRNVLYKGKAMVEGETIEAKEDDADTRYIVAIGKAVVVKAPEKQTVEPPENEAKATPEKEVVSPAETASGKGQRRNHK